jgi:O-antigen ligase
MTQSRGGIGATLVAISLIILLFFVRGLSKHSVRIYCLLFTTFILALIAALPWTGIGFRLSQAGLVDLGRREAYAAVVAALREAPVFGTGLGTFRDVLPMFRQGSDTLGVWGEAHSSPLQFALEMGLPLTLVAAGVAFYVAVALLRGFFKRRRYPELPLCGLAVLTVGAVHSFVDFSLQIPGYAIPWAGLIAIGLAQSKSRRGGRESPVRTHFGSVASQP